MTRRNWVGLVVALLSMFGAFYMIELAEAGDLSRWVATPVSLFLIVVMLVAAQFIGEP